VTDELDPQQALVEEIISLRRRIVELERAEKKLKESEERFRIGATSASDLIWDWSILQGKLEWFGAIDEMLGYAPGEFLRTIAAWENMIHPDDRARVMSTLEKHLNTQTPYIEEYRVIAKDGTLRYWKDRGGALRDEKGNAYRMVGACTDITEQKKMQEDLRANEQKFRGLIEKMPIGTFIYEGTKIRYVNPMCEKITGYTQDELYLFDIWDIVHLKFKDIVREYVYRRLRKEPVPELLEIKIITKSGVDRWLERGAIAIELQGKPFVLVTIIDVTERKLAEEALEASELKYRSLMDNASDAILLADIQGNIVEANRKAEELWGYAKDELLQMHYTQLHPALEMERTIAAFREVIEKNTGHLSGGFIQRKDGEIVPVDITCNVIEYCGRKVGQASFRDISEHKQTEDMLEGQVRERTAALSEKNNQLVKEITERKRAEAALRKKTNELLRHSGKLEELNAALKVLLKQREEDKADLEEKVISNVQHLLSPQLDKLKKRKFGPQSKMHLDILESNLNNIVSSFSHKLSSNLINLTPTEIRVANLIREGKTTKEIAEFLGSSPSSINIHRFHIRRKLGLIGKETNLESYLTSLS
jgi:PAS domain S-box-containing protein